MTVKVEHLPDLSAILITYFDIITLDDLDSAFLQSADITAQGHPIAYRLLHNDDAETNFADVLQLARASITKLPPSDRPYELILVGHDRWTKLYVDIMSQKQFGGRAIPCFGTLDQALAYVRSQRAEQQW